MKVQIEISDTRISDLLHGHGGRMSPWLHELSGTWDEPGGVFVKFDRPEDEEGSGKGRKKFGPSAVRKGLAAMALNESYQFSQFLEENDDDITFDTFVQCIIFGKCVYA